MRSGINTFTALVIFLSLVLGFIGLMPSVAARGSHLVVWALPIAVVLSAIILGIPKLIRFLRRR